MVDTSSSLNPDAMRCTGSRQIASYSNARATDSNSVNLSLRAWSSSAEEAPLGLAQAGDHDVGIHHISHRI